jgi:hypothetical protein
VAAGPSLTVTRPGYQPIFGLSLGWPQAGGGGAV